VDAVLEDATSEGSIVSAVVLIAQGGRTVYRRAAGYADREEGRPVSENSIFRLASMTKPIVCATALALIEDRVLNLDTPISTWLADFRPRLPDGHEVVITVRHLLTHTAGLTYGFLQPDGGAYHEARISDGIAEPGLSMAENLGRLASVPLLYEPGTSWSYSLATDVLGEVVSRAGGAPLPEMVRRKVTGPLGLKDTGFSVSDPARLVTPYADADTAPRKMGELHLVPFDVGNIRFAPSRITDPNSYPSAGAGMAGTAPDYLVFLEALRTGGAPILHPETVRAMTSNAIGDIPVPLVGEGWGYGLGVGVLRDPAPMALPHAPGTWRLAGVYGNHGWVDPDAELSVVVLTNTAIAGMWGTFPDRLMDAIYDRS
jgi:CubicO group peptidase (beta-lactamase class C family)